LQQLDHPRIPAYIDYDADETTSDVQFMLVQEYIEGKALQQLVEEGWRCSETTFLDLLTQLVDILNYLHTLNPPVIHRDIHPKNILLSSDNTVYLVDFGAVQDQLRTEFLGGSTVVGTYGYIPFEQFSGQAVPASDYYALGATLLYVLTHRHPADFQNEGMKPDLSEVVTASPKIVHLLEGLLEPSAKNRIASPEEIEQVLQRKPDSPQKHVAQAPLPYGTKIKKLEKEVGHIQFFIPGKFGSESIFMLGFSIFWLSFVTIWTTFAVAGSVLFALFSIPFWLVGLGMLSMTLFRIFGRTILELTPEWILVKYSFLNLRYTRRIPTALVNKIDVSTWYLKNNQPVQAINLYAGAETVKFGSHLTKTEQEWLIRQIEEYTVRHAKSV
jgi:serine/threonine protein kinase